MIDAADRSQVLINDLLSLSRVATQAQPFARVDLNKLLRSVSLRSGSAPRGDRRPGGD